MNLQYIHGADGIQSLFEQALDNKEKMLRTALSGRPLVYLAGDAFAEAYMQQRRDAKIFLKSLRFSLANVDLPQHKDYAAYHKAVRIAPKEIGLAHSIILWDDFVAIFAPADLSGKIIQDDVYATVMKSWFDYIWEQSVGG